MSDPVFEQIKKINNASAAAIALEVRGAMLGWENAPVETLAEKINAWADGLETPPQSGEVMYSVEGYCTCHERDSSYTCDYCKSLGLYGHMERPPFRSVDDSMSRSIAAQIEGGGYPRTD